MWKGQLRRTLAATSVLLWMLYPRPVSALDRPAPPKAAAEVEVTLLARGTGSGPQIVSFGLPLPPQGFDNARLVRVLDEQGVEVAAAVRSLEPWRIDGREGTIRSLLIQFSLPFDGSTTRKVRVAFGKPRTSERKEFVPVADTLIDRDGLQGPRVLAVLPAKWMCDSWVAGPQVPAAASGPYAAYNAYIEKNFPSSIKYLDSETFDHWLFDRTSGYYKMYVRTGDRKFLEAAYHAAHFVRTHTRMEGEGAGAFTLKGEYDDLKYVYPRAMHLHYLLTGDERALEAGKVMARYTLNNWDPVYRPKVATEVGGQSERVFWTERHTGYGFLGVLHGWEMTGDRAYWDKAKGYADALYEHQQRPPDGRPADGSFRRFSRTDKGFRGTASAWMTSILIDPIFHYWTLTGDARIPSMVVAWCDFLDKHGIRPDGRQAYYMLRSPQSDPGTAPSDPGPDMELHNTEMAYMFAMGIYFSTNPSRTAAYRTRFDTLFSIAMAVDHFKVLDHRALQGRETEPSVRSFNWATQASSQLVYFMQNPGAGGR